MIVVIDQRLGNHQQPVVTARVAIDDGGACIAPRPVRSELFPVQGIIQIDKLRFVKMYIAHFCGF